MSGLEVFFLDGGTTVAAVLSAGAAALGYKQHHRDNAELANEEDIEYLQQATISAHDSMNAGHQALTATWGSPLSLFDEHAEQKAAERGVPIWAVKNVREAQLLVEQSAELSDLADLYQLQLRIAAKEGRGLMRAPVLELTTALESCGGKLTAHIRELVLARDAFDLPAEAPIDDPSSKRKPSRIQEQVKDAPAANGAPTFSDLPVAILRDRGQLGEIFRSATESHEALRRTLLRRGSLDGKEPDGPKPEPEMSSYVLAYM